MNLPYSSLSLNFQLMLNREQVNMTYSPLNILQDPLTNRLYLSRVRRTWKLSCLISPLTRLTVNSQLIYLFIVSHSFFTEANLREDQTSKFSTASIYKSSLLMVHELKSERIYNGWGKLFEKEKKITFNIISYEWCIIFLVRGQHLLQK